MSNTHVHKMISLKQIKMCWIILSEM